MEYRIKQACGYYKSLTGESIEKELSLKLFPESTGSNLSNKWYNLKNNITKRLEADQIFIICKMTGVSSDFLVGLSDKFN